MKLRYLSSVFGAAACLGAAHPGFAADMAAPPPYVAAPVSTWAGFYFGGQIGALVDEQHSYGVHRNAAGAGNGGGGGAAVQGGTGGDGGDGGNAGSVNGKVDNPEMFTGFHVGYNWQLNRALVGIEGDVDSYGQSGTLGTGRVRFGLALDQVLLYGTAGIAWLSQDGRDTGVFIGGDGGAGGDGGWAGMTPGAPGGARVSSDGYLYTGHGSTSETGFVIGGGAELKLSPQVSVGLEGLYYAFDANDTLFASDDDFFTVRARVSFHPGAAWSGGPVASWGGLYAGVHLGALYNAADKTLDNVALADGEPGTPGGDGIGMAGGGGGGGGGGASAFAAFDPNPSLVFGAHVGYNWQAGNIVYGAEADISGSGSDAHKYLGSLRGRLGWAEQSYLFYGTAGVAFARNEGVRAIFAGHGEDGFDGDDAEWGGAGGSGGAGGFATALVSDDTEVGFVVGAGLEAKIASYASLGVEALYYGFDNDDLPSGLPAPGRAFASDDDNSALVLRTRLSVQFAR